MVTDFTAGKCEAVINNEVYCKKSLRYRKGLLHQHHCHQLLPQRALNTGILDSHRHQRKLLEYRQHCRPES